MLLENAVQMAKQNQETLHYYIDQAIREVLHYSNIAEIDRTTRTKLINAVIMNRQVVAGEYNQNYIKNIIKSTLADIENETENQIKRNSGIIFRW